MNALMAPWRYDYITRDKDKGAASCPFCMPGDDRSRLVVHRGELCFVMLNAYPYASGHLMVLPLRHISDLTLLTSDEAVEFHDLIRRALECLRRAYHPQGVNIGINLGSAAGAGVTEHLHCHLVPRWAGDSNFMQVLGGTSVLPQSLEESWALLREAWR